MPRLHRCIHMTIQWKKKRITGPLFSSDGFVLLQAELLPQLGRPSSVFKACFLRIRRRTDAKFGRQVPVVHTFRQFFYLSNFFRSANAYLFVFAFFFFFFFCSVTGLVNKITEDWFLVRRIAIKLSWMVKALETKNPINFWL